MSYGVGQGLNEGVKEAGNFILQGLQLGQRQAYVDAYTKRQALAGFNATSDWDAARNLLRPPRMMQQGGAGPLMQNKVP